MSRQHMLWIGFVLLAINGPVAADSDGSMYFGAPAERGGTLNPPGSPDGTPGLHDPLGAPPIGRLPDEFLLSLIAAWLSENFGLPANGELPSVRLVLPEELAALRLRDSPSASSPHSQRGGGPAASPSRAHDVVALYDDTSRTIYLQAGWTGYTPAELSVLVHEMVHHLQNLAGLRYECPGARERTAYAAQQQWLELFGHDLESDFSIDPMTLLVRGTCST